LLTLWALLMLRAPALLAATVEVFSPQGEVKGVRQVGARFSEPMVALGDPRLAEPFDIDCSEQGTARWADQKNWVYDFERDLPAGVQCAFGVKRDLRTLAGAQVEPARFAFSTGGPAVVEHLPYRYQQIDEEQVFILALDAPASEASILAHAWCDAKGIEERIAVQPVQGEERARILEARKDFVDRFLVALFKDGRLAGVAERHLLRGTSAENLRAADPAKLPLTLLRCARRLPAESPLRLVWGKGIESLSGVPTTQDQVLEFTVRPAFAASFSCRRANPAAGCLPFAPMQLRFSAPIARASAQKITLRGAQKAHKPTLPDASQAGDWVDAVSFDGPFPEQAAFKLEIPADLRDDAGRRLANQRRFPLAVKTDVAPPLAKFPARFGIIELKADATLPVTLRNLEPQVAARVWSAAGAGPVPGGVLRIGNADARSVADWLRRVRQHQNVEWVEGEEGEPGGRAYAAQRSILAGEERVRAIKVPKPAGARAFEVVGIPLKRPGFYVVELASPKLGAALLTGSHPGATGGEVYHVSTAALVTNLSVHFKHGRESSLVWVTTLDSGAPVARAQVSVQDCSGKEHAKALTDARGLARVPKQLPARDRLPGCLSDYDRQYMVFARLGGDVSFVMSDWDEGISRWRFNLPQASWQGPFVATTVFDRTLVRAGETAHMKHFYRRHVRGGLRSPAAGALPKEASIEHQGSEQRYQLPVKWDARGSAVSDWLVPRDAKTGVYRVVFEDTLNGRVARRSAGTFRVEEFRVPLMRASIDPPAKPLVNPQRVEIGVQVSYLAGGGAANAPVKVRSVVQPRAVGFPGYEEFALLAGAVTEGVQDEPGQAWVSGDTLLADGDELPADAARGPATKPLETQSLTLDNGGGGKLALTGIPSRPTPQEVVTELEYTDPNGEVLTTSARIAVWPAGLVLGLKPDSWALSKDKVKFQAVALDLAGKPLQGVPVALTLFERKTFSHRKRLLGGFYAYQSGAEIKRVNSVCEGTTDAKGLLFCEFASPVSGEVLIEARARDAAGNQAATYSSAWVAGGGEWWFDLSNDDRMDVLPERKRYEPGEKAVLQVRMPFRKAYALVTVEREGVMDAFVQELSGKAPVVEVPLRWNHAPNVFVSVLAVRGRVGDVRPTALVDLGKPAFKMGVAQIDVGWRGFELKVKVTADKPLYRVRERAKVGVAVRRAADGKPPPKGAEVALAAVDEGLLELAPNDSWKLLQAMMQRRGIEVDTATASMQVVGKRHYGRKAREAGGGGGRKTSRELFDTLLFWQARVKLDARGRANVEIPLNDSLTSFRIVAVASGGAGLFGTGQTTVRSSQELMLFSGLPPLVREQDGYRALFTARNAGDAPLEIALRAQVAPEADGARGAALEQEPVALSLAPGASQEVGWEARAPLGAQALHWEVSASAKTAAGQSVNDALEVRQSVIAAVPVRTFQATVAQVERGFDLPVQMPGDAIPGRGGVRVTLAPKLGGELPGVREFMSRYAYTCLEQIASQAVALRDAGRWSRLMASLPTHLDRDGFAMYFPGLGRGSDALTTYLLSIANEAGWEIPEAPRARMQRALEGFVAGQVTREPEWRAADLSIRKIAALQALARWGKAVQDGDLASLSIEPNLWPTSAVIDWLDLLGRAPQVAQRDQRLAEAEQILRSRLNFQGATMGFSTERTDYLWWLMISGDVNANRMLLAALQRPQWREDLPRLARGSLGRQQRGHWNTTVANAWGVLALEKFSALLETEPVAGVTRATLALQARSRDWGAGEAGAEWLFAWPAAPQGAKPVRGTLHLAHEGSGKPWATLQSLAAIPLKQALSSGYRIKRSIGAVERKHKDRWSRGDVMRVRLELEAQSDMSWVVVNDPLPGGASALGTGLARDSQILTAGERREGWVWPAFEERRLDSFRAYYRFVPKGKWILEYSVRLNNPGAFSLPPTRVEALYAPEMFGELPNAVLEIVP
jgi:uncharacterized protein YfaS (alpha-2-macroglobulin family)